MHVQPGDNLNIDDPILTLETEKAAMEIPSPISGALIEVYVQNGDKINQGDDLCLIEAIETDPVAEENEEKDTEPEINNEGSPQMTRAQKPVERSQKNDRQFFNTSFASVHASPSVRKLSRELGVDLNQVNGSGMKGRILPEDLKSFVKGVMSGKIASVQSALPKLPEVDHSAFGDIESVPLSRIKKISGPRLQASWINIPHVTQHDEVDINNLEQLRMDLKKSYQSDGISLSILPFIVMAVCQLLKQMPDFNSSLDEKNSALIHKKYINIGFAANTDQGLMVPVIKNADQKSLKKISQELVRLSEDARSGKIKLEDLQGGTFTISSLGGFGGVGFTPIINPPEVAILGVARAQIRPIMIKGKFLPRLILPLSLSYDHRVIDGVGGIQFTTALKQLLENPDSFLSQEISDG
ncbi:MAG: dihydrolipoamide acetyltransferase [Gammaproteobacteria bacterium]|nr:dihydrolipoamide acetyltransferase [Gammaproteobacteria bacterium]|tara:strand:- start:38888 stop:40120 length:1233 start_codon:yes stop_codon:yes gene_type:complete